MAFKYFIAAAAALMAVIAPLQGQGGPQLDPNDPASAAVREGQQLVRAGRLEDASAKYAEALQKWPDSFQANNQAGVAMDLLGKYGDARARFARAIELAPTPQAKAQAQRAMAMSYAFEGDCAGAAKYETPLYDQYAAAGDAFNAGEIANELARICLESGKVDEAEKWYRTGHEAGLKESNISPARKDLWEFRWEHALARIAARRGRHAEAQQHVTAAKAILDRGTNPEQAPFFPYLVGYVAFYGGHSRAAVDALLKGNQSDPFILSLIAQAYEKLGDNAQATDYYRKVLAIPIHNPTGAFSRPLARKKIG